MANSTVEETIEVDVPVSEAYNQWTQFSSFPHFMSGVKEISQIDDTHNHWVASVGGVTREFDTVITEERPDVRIAWKSVDGKSHAGAVDFHRLSDSKTQVSVQMDWAPEGLVEKAGAAIGIDDRQIKTSLTSFKKYIESQDTEDGAWRGEIKPNN